MSNTKEFNFKVQTLEAGQRGKYQDSYYSYEVTSTLSEHFIKKFCMNVIQESCKRSDMANLFQGELLKFEKITDNNKGRDWREDRLEETYVYECKSAYTG